jgi:hypothetical protein
MPLQANSIAVTAAQREEILAGLEPSRIISANTTLVWPDAGNTHHEVSSATAVALTLPTGAIRLGAKIKGNSIGSGALSFVGQGGDVLRVNAILPATVDQNSPWMWERCTGGWLRVA